MTLTRVFLVAIVAAGCKDGSRSNEQRAPDARRSADAAARRARSLDSAPTLDAAPVLDRRTAADLVLSQGCGGSPIETVKTHDSIVAECERSDATSGEVTRLRIVRAPDDQVRSVAVVLRGPSPRTPKRMKTALDLLAPILDEHLRELGGNILSSAIRAPLDPATPVEASGVWLAGASHIDDEAAPWQRSVVLEIRFDDGPPAAPTATEPPATIGELEPSGEAMLEANCRDDYTMERLLGQPVSPAVDDDNWITEPTGRWTASDVWLRCVVRLSGGHRFTLAATLYGTNRGLLRLAIQLDHGSRDTLGAVLDHLGAWLLPDSLRAAAVAVARGRPADAIAGARIQYARPGGRHRVTITATR